VSSAASCERVKPFILIAGPTASGKSALGLKLARHFGGGILNCDSLQTYQRLDIGTAKPTLAERAQVPHYLFDVVRPGEILTAGDYRRMALEVLSTELPRRPVFGVGGSGFYIQALEKGMFDVPKPRPESELFVRELLEEKGPAHLYRELQRLDPEYAEVLNPNDSYRITRAMIIIKDSGRKVTDLRAEFSAKPFPFPLLKLGLAPEREFLMPRVQKRTAQMLADGFLQEVRRLLEDGYASWPPLQSVGYRECLQVLSGDLPAEKLSELIVEKTMQLSKKQRTWFKRDAGIHWLDCADPFARAKELSENFLAAH